MGLQLPHWLMIAGAIFIFGGFLGLVLTRKQRADTPEDVGPDDKR
jgi:hypothetical protein